MGPALPPPTQTCLGHSLSSSLNLRLPEALPSGLYSACPSAQPVGNDTGIFTPSAAFHFVLQCVQNLHMEERCCLLSPFIAPTSFYLGVGREDLSHVIIFWLIPLKMSYLFMTPIFGLSYIFHLGDLVRTSYLIF